MGTILSVQKWNNFVKLAIPNVVTRGAGVNLRQHRQNLEKGTVALPTK